MLDTTAGTGPFNVAKLRSLVFSTVVTYMVSTHISKVWINFAETSRADWCWEAVPVSDVVTAEFLRADQQGTGEKAWLGQLSTPGQACFLYKQKKKSIFKARYFAESPQYPHLVEPLILPISIWNSCELTFIL